MKRCILYILAYVFFSVTYILIFDPCPKICVWSFVPPFFFWLIFVLMHSHGWKTNADVVSAQMKSGTLFDYDHDDEFDRALMNKPRDEKFILMDKYLNHDFIHNPEDDLFDENMKKLKVNKKDSETTMVKRNTLKEKP